MSFGNRILVLGGGRTGIALHNLLQFTGQEHQWIADTRLITHPESYVKQFDTVIVSPGIPRSNSFLSACCSEGIRVMSELEYAAQFCPVPLTAITGTNGKTTVTHMLHAIFCASGADSFCVGNCGVPLSTVVGQASSRSRIACEVSSFMLEHADGFCPHVATVTNLAPDHLDRHGDWFSYVDAKRSIYKNMTESDFFVRNDDDAASLAYLNPPRARLLTYSVHDKSAFCHVDGEEILLDGMRLIDVGELKSKGVHSISNAMAGAVLAYVNGISAQVIAGALRNFRGVPHRMEYVGSDARRVAFYNDSKSTNIASTLVALRAFTGEIVLIAGGSTKGYEFDELLAALCDRPVKLVATGSAMTKLAQAAARQGFSRITCEPDFKKAVLTAAEIAKSKANVLLSPACASFDAFKDYRERGDVFRRIVREEILSARAPS